MFEILTLRQTGKMNPLPVVLAMREYWESVIDFKAMVKAGVVDATDLDLFSYADDAPGIWESLNRVGLRRR